MNRSIYFTIATRPIRNLMSRSPLRRGFLLVLLMLGLGCLALPSVALAQLPSPTPDGGYPNNNTAEGENALFNLTTGTDNTAIGYRTLLSLTTGSENTATGSGALFSNTTGIRNTANGFSALESNTTGQANTANGVEALFSNTTGTDNTANGVDALEANTTGSYNTADGLRALFSNTTGHNNTAEGFQALATNTTGSSNIAFGTNAGQFTTGSNNIDIGNQGVAGESNAIRIGKAGTQTATFISGIFGATIASGVQVIIGSGGHLGTVTSSARFKEAIKPMDKASEAILALKPVTFRYKHELDPEGIPQFGLVAEQVEEVNPDLVVRDAEGKVYTVRYEAVNAMLLNEFLKQHRTVQEQKATIAQLRQDFQSRLAEQQKQIEALTAGLQKVSAQLALKKPAPQIVVDNQ
jgi:hypothetical protein